MGDIRITENSRLATAAAAIKHRIVNRRSPRVFLPVLPLKKGSSVVADIVGVGEKNVCRGDVAVRYICSHAGASSSAGVNPLAYSTYCLTKIM